MSVDSIYTDLVDYVLTQGTRKSSRPGPDTISVFGFHYTADVSRVFPMLTSKYVSWKNIVVELLWFLSGSDNIAFLHKHGVHFWDAWADENGKIPYVYGEMWRHGFGVDQVQNAITLLKKDPDTRRAVVSAWHPRYHRHVDLPPCHAMYVFNTQYTYNGLPELCLHLTQRSCDIALGLPYNIASYALLLHIVARCVGVRASLFSHSIVDAHIYTSKTDGSMSEYNHVPNLCLQIDRDPMLPPTLEISDRILCLDDIDSLIKEGTTEEILEAFKLEGYESHPALAYKVAV